MAKNKDGKKKKGCLGRIIKFSIVAVVVLLVIGFLLDDEDYDYISSEEIASGNEDFDYDSLLDFFFDYYGFYPEEDNDYNYFDFYDEQDYRDSDYADYDDYDKYDDYYDKFDDNNSFYNYYNDFSDYYDQQDNSTAQTKAPSSKDSYSGHTAESISSSYLTKFVDCAKKYLGTPYVWGGTSKAGVDCSGLVYLAAQDAGLGTLPRTAKTLYAITSKIDKKELQSGDLVFFQADNSISHVAIYIGNNQILHAISEGSETGVVISKLSKDYWKKHYYASGRIMSDAVTSKRAVTRAQTMNKDGK